MPLKPPRIELDRQRMEGFLQRAEKGLDPEDFAFLSTLVGGRIFLGGLVEKKSSAIARLLRLIFGFKTRELHKYLRKSSPDIRPA